MPSETSLVLQAYYCYRSLIEAAGSAHSAEHGLGGKLLYVGELDEQGRAVAIAGNVAGCATLSATADSEAQKQGVRDGVVDFLVTSLDEALRILKNEIRKHSTVAVCIASPTDSIEREILERGVQPDILGSELSLTNTKTASLFATVVWSVQSFPAKWLPRLDAIALECLQPSDGWNRAWIQRSPRYLGRAASNLRAVGSDREFAASYIEHLRSAFDRGEIGTAANVRVTAQAGSEEHNFQPAKQAAG